MPGLHRVDVDVVGDRVDLARPPSSAGISNDPGDARVFCAVMAVMALVPYTPSAAKVLRSAWMPARRPSRSPRLSALYA